MTVTLDMPKEIEAQFAGAAQARGVPLSDYVRNFIVEQYQEVADDLRTAQERLADLNPASLTSCAKTLAWTVEYDLRVEKDLKAIDRAMQREILDYMDTRIATEDPRRFGKPLRHELRGLWRYRVRGYRIICDILEQTAWCSF